MMGPMMKNTARGGWVKAKSVNYGALRAGMRIRTFLSVFSEIVKSTCPNVISCRAVTP